MDFQTKVKEIFATLSTGQKKVAKYLLDHPHEFAIHSAQEIGEVVGVSETTIIRFCYSLQLKGFSELQKIVRNQIFVEKSSLNEYYSSKKQVMNEPNFLESVMKQDMTNIKKTIENLSKEDFLHVVKRLSEADYILISGLRSSFAAAHWLGFTLSIVRDDIHVYRPDIDDVFLQLNKMSENSIFIALSFHRYMKETIKLTKMAKEAGAFVIGITDSELAPIADFSDVLLPISKSRVSTIDTAPVLFSLLNALVAGVSLYDEKAFKERKAKYDSFNEDEFFYK
ncbi:MULTISPECIES: MurR/RpiR family transcriptional regulator [Bacillus]|uniref:MurR/RpiR family transcriptional regulator n=1 Tax=Bacillus TaxID=1386 RepID=UPI0002FD5602|nr:MULTISPECIES: MurR/RpiR family transcriptional regulator [Bacillus]